MKMAMGEWVLSLALLVVIVSISSAEEKCEVCVNVLTKFSETITDADRTDKEKLEGKLRKFCKTVKGKDERFCFFIGARPDSATSTVGDILKPMAYFMPVDKICDKLQQKDSQICELKYEKQLDLVSLNLPKMKVKELKKVLELWGEGCKGCTEKSDYIEKIEQLMPQYAPEAAAARAAKAKEEL